MTHKEQARQHTRLDMAHKEHAQHNGIGIAHKSRRNNIKEQI